MAARYRLGAILRDARKSALLRMRADGTRRHLTYSARDKRESAKALVRWRRQFFKKFFKIGIVHFDEVSAVKSIDAGLDLPAQRRHLQGVFVPPLLEHAERILDHLARLLILASPHDTFDEGVLLGGQADV